MMEHENRELTLSPQQKWYAEWKDKLETRNALRLFNDIGGTERDRAITLHRINLACFNAIHYVREKDPGEEYRKKITEEKQRRSSIQSAAHVLAMSASRNDKALSWALDFAESQSGVRLTRKVKTEAPDPDSSEKSDFTEAEYLVEERSGVRLTRRVKNEPKPQYIPMSHNLVAERYFSSLESALKGILPELDGGPFFHRFKIGNLIADNAKKSGRKIEIKTMLAFELTFYLRMLTAGHASDSPQQGAHMPTQGDPCYSVVAAFCNAALKPKILFDSEQIKSHLKERIKNYGLINWPSECVIVPERYKGD